jgi:hypothetical protein
VSESWAGEHVLGFFEDCIDTDTSDKEGLLLIVVGKELSKNDDIRIGDPRLFDHITSDIELSSMAVVKPESIEHFGHSLDIIFHVLPSVGRIRGFLAIPNSEEIAPYIDPSPEVVKMLGKGEILPAVSTGHPSIVQCIETLLLSSLVLFGNA